MSRRLTTGTTVSMPLIVVWVALLDAMPVQASEPRAVFESWTTENGLPQNSVNDILQTRDGYLWLATFGGLVRFDGVRFVIFDRSVAGIENQRVYSLHEDRAGTLWAGAESGTLIRYRNGAFTTYTHEDGLPQSAIHRIEEDEAGVLWFSALDGIARFDGTRFVTLTPADFDHRVTAPSATEYLDVWWRQDAGVLHALVKGRVRTYAIRNLIGDAKVAGVNVDRRGNVWINTIGSGVIKASGQRLARLTTGDGIPPDHSEGMFFEGSDSEIWFADGRRVWRIRDGTNEPLQVPGMPHSGPRALYVDNEGSTWIGTTASGLHRLTDAPVTLYDARDGVSLRIAYAIVQDRTGAIWISTGGLHRYADGHFVSFTPADGLPALVTCLYEDTKGTLWVGTTRGLSSVQDGKWMPYADRSGYLGASIWAILQDKAGTYWYATSAGLVSINGAKVVRYTVADGLSHTRASALFQDRDGALWIGTFQGLTRLANGEFRTYTTRDGFIGNDVRALHQDADGFMWIGTYDGGLYRLANERLTRFSRADGLHDNGVFQILEDENGFLWMGSNRGIQRISRRELNEFADGRRRVLTPVVLGAKDGLASVEVNGGRQPAGLRAADGRMWFPTMAGVAVVDPAQARSSAQPANVLIEEVRVAGMVVDASKPVQVPYEARAIDIRYTAPTFVSPEFVRFRHRLVGLHGEWNDAGERREASYYGLPPGRYQFQVVAAGNGGEWSVDTASLELVVPPPFWRTTWFLALSVSGTIALAFASHRMRMRHFRRMQALGERFSRRLIENQERERERISGDMHDSLGQSLRIIRKLARTGQQGLAPGEGQTDATLAEISGLAERIQSEMTEIAYDLRPHHLDTLGLSKTVETMIRRVERNCAIRFITDIAAVDEMIPDASRIHVFRIIQEAVSNIVQHSNATEARVMLAGDGRQIQLKIEDNGIGFSPNGGAPREQGSGFGLMGIRERARILGGRLNVDSATSRGTTVVMTLAMESLGDD